MNRNPTDNKYLTLRSGLIRSPQSDVVICALDKYFEARPKQITSIKRDPRDQMRIIINYALKFKIPVNFDEGSVDIKLDNGNYIWQDIWSKLLSIGIMANPPREAACLYQYMHSVKGTVPAGTVIRPSSHFSGDAFDIDGIVGEILDKAMKDEPEIGIASYLVEHSNDCTHVNVKEA